LFPGNVDNLFHGSPLEGFARTVYHGFMNDSDWNSLYEQYERLALRVAWQFLYTEEDVQDVVQEAAAAVWARRRHLSDDEAFCTLFIGAVVNQCRKRRRSYSRSEDEPQLPAPASPDTPADAALKAELRKKVSAALAVLPPEQSETVVLCLMEGMSYVDAAKAMGLTVPALRNHLYRARKALRDALEDSLG
jgi:RNA polymerase sigma-70 factor (ECF subfamily)